MKEKKTKVMLNVLVFTSILLVGIGVSFSYLSSRRTSTLNMTKNPTAVTAKTADDLKIIYTDCKDDEASCKGINKDLEPGESVTKEFKVTNSSEYDVEYTLYFQDIINSYINDELVYKLENTDTNKTIVETKPVPYYKKLGIDVPLAENLKVKIGETDNYRLTVTFLNKDYDQSENLDAEYYFTISFISSSRKQVAGLNEYPRISAPNYSESTIIDEGLYESVDDYGTTYYYRGDVKNNYVFFANQYFRIIRLNGNGTLRVIYDGTTPHENTDASPDRLLASKSAWASGDNDIKYLGYMQPNANVSNSIEDVKKHEINSSVKQVVDDWYKTTIEDKGFGTYVSDAIFCNDLSVSSGLGYGINQTYYNGYKRLRTNTTPSFKCQNKDNAYTKSDSMGNQALTYPVGLITADEVIASGVGSYETGSSKNYLYRGEWYWTMTPDSFDKNGFIYYMDGGNLARLSATITTSTGGVAPVINLSQEFVNSMQGTGTITDPYRI